MRAFFEMDVDSPGDIWRFLIWRGLPVIATGILMLIISGSGGLIPPTWSQLFDLLLHLKTYMVGEGVRAMFWLLMVIMQALILTIAWIVYIILVIKAVGVFKELLSQMEHSHSVALATIGEKQVEILQMEERTRKVLTTQRAYTSSIPKKYSSDPPTYDTDSNPFAIEEGDRFLLDQPRRRSSSQARPPQPPPQVQVQQIQPQLPAPPVTRKAVNPYVAHESPVTNPFTSPGPLAAAPPGQPANNIGNTTAHKTRKEAAPEFIFGNPFESNLPDVFHEDEDLKRSLENQ